MAKLVRISFNLVAVRLFGRVFTVSMPFMIEPSGWRYAIRHACLLGAIMRRGFINARAQ
jgi:hypothetical protein